MSNQLKSKNFIWILITTIVIVGVVSYGGFYLTHTVKQIAKAVHPHLISEGQQTTSNINATNAAKVPNNQVTILYRVEQTSTDTKQIEGGVNAISAEIDQALRPFNADQQTLNRTIFKQPRKSIPIKRFIPLSNTQNQNKHQPDTEWTIKQDEKITTTKIEDVSNIIQTIENHQGLISKVQFDVSRSTQDKIKSKLTQQAINRFRQKAAEITQSLGLPSYRIKSINIDSNQPRPIMNTIISTRTSVASPTLKTGMGEIRVHVRGVITLPSIDYPIDSKPNLKEPQQAQKTGAQHE